MAASGCAAMKSSARAEIASRAPALPSLRRIPSVRLHVQTGSGAAPGSRRPTSGSTLPTRCSSAERMYVSGRPDSKISRIILAARLSAACSEKVGVVYGTRFSVRSCLERTQPAGKKAAAAFLREK